tara:strand:- start:24 stop:770 length:747 start_codon:yes stop_codon:yes gene_type:complete
MRGFVSFVSSGPGDPGLLTIKALNRIKCATIILYDELSSGSILNLVNKGTDLINVGKKAGLKSLKQEEISKLLVRYAKNGNKVVRLKSGDCSIFGRLEEEITALKKANISYEIIPGVSSIFAAMAEAGIPLTRRKESRKVQFITGHDLDGNFPNELKNKSLCDLNTTTVVFMAKRNYSVLLKFLISKGLSKSTPAIVAVSVSKPNQKIYKTTISDAQDYLIKENVKNSPTLIIYGPLDISSIKYNKNK